MYASGTETLRLAAGRPRSRPAGSRWALVGLASVFLICCSLAQAAGGGAAGTYDRVRVGPGDTVWSIAAERYPGSDPRARVGEILRANHLSDPMIQPGQVLLVPSR